MQIVGEVHRCEDSDEYQNWARLGRERRRANTPDPLDSSVRKRPWEEKVRLWKDAMRKDLDADRW